MYIYDKIIHIKSILEIKRVQSQLIQNIAAQNIYQHKFSKINFPKINFINIYKSCNHDFFSCVP